MVAAELPCNVFWCRELFNLAGFFVNGGIAEGGVNVRHFDLDGVRYEAAGSCPESPDAGKSFRDRFLMFLVEVLAEIGAASHVPGDEVLFVVVEPFVLLALGFGDTVPCVGHEGVKAGGVVGEGEEEVEVRGTTGLKFQYPEVPDAGKLSAQSL